MSSAVPPPLSVPEIGFDLLSFAERLANEAGTILRRYFRKNHRFEFRREGSLQIEAETNADKAIIEMIRRNYPSHGIISENFSPIQTQNDYVWVINSINGTRTFITGKPVFCSVIALLYHGKPIIGIIHQPILRETWIGAHNARTRFNGITCQTRNCLSIERAVLNSTSPDNYGRSQMNPRIAKIKEKVSIVTYGGDAYAFGMLCNGHLDICVDDGQDKYVFMALVPIIEGAGGRITDFDGQPLTFHSEGNVVATASARLQDTALKILRS